MSQRIGFFKALIGTCCGTAVFSTLRQVSWWRVVSHLLLLCVLVAAVVGSARSRRLEPMFKAAEIVFAESFGSELRYHDGAFWPTKNPEQSRTLNLPLGGQVCYGGVGQAPQVPAAEAWLKHPFFVVWSGRSLVNLARIDDQRWSVLTRDATGQLNLEVIEDEATLKELFTSSVNMAPPQETEKIPTADLFRSFRLIGNFWLYGGMLVQAFLVTWAYTGLFMLVFRISGARNLRALTCSEMWKCGIYAGFPAMLVAMCFPWLDLPWLSFDTVYMMGMMIYWLVVTNTLERQLRRSENADLQ